MTLFHGILRMRQRVTYGCGNCRRTFKNEAEQQAHMPCAQYLVEKDLAEWNARIEAEWRKRGIEVDA